MVLAFLELNLIAIIVLITIAFICYRIKVIYNYYPNETFKIELTNKRSMNDNDLIDYYIINYGTQQIESHIRKIGDWKNEKIASFQGNEKKIEKFAERCYKNQIKAFGFVGYRIQTRYKQINYKRYPYQVEVITNNVTTDESFILERISLLRKHNYDVTYNQYTKADQRKALTKQLREKIKMRDHYTCQICGKYMIDEVGLQIDHIIPVSKGGKSIPSNLRVTCSKCNGHKGGR